MWGLVYIVNSNYMQAYMKKNKITHRVFLLTALFLLVVMGAISCSKPSSNIPEAKKTKYTAIDYFDVNSPTTIKINDVEYAFIEDNVTWIHALYYKKDFTGIHDHILSLLDSKEEEKSHELTRLYRALVEITDDKHIDLMHSVLNEWCSKQPDSHIPWLVRGSFYITWAWSIRGAGWAKDVQKEAWSKFEEKLRMAKKDIDQSFKLNPNDPNSSYGLLIIAKGLGLPKNIMEEYYQNGIKTCPWHFGIHSQKLEYLKPKWSGSREEMFEFANQCLALSTQYPRLGVIMANAYKEDHKYNEEKENVLGREDVWPIIERIYTVLFEKYPDNLRLNFSYAYYAYLAKKDDIAMKHFEAIGNRWMEGTEWSSLEWYNSCRAFTYYRIGHNLLFQKRLYQVSIDYFQSAIRYKPTADAYYGLGIAYWHTGNSLRDVSLLRKAEESLKKAVQMKPDHKQAQEQLKKLQSMLNRV